MKAIEKRIRALEKVLPAPVATEEEEGLPTPPPGMAAYIAERNGLLDLDFSIFDRKLSPEAQLAAEFTRRAKAREGLR